MKKIIIPALLFFLSFTFTSCDKVPPRIAPPKPDCVLHTPIVNTNTATSNYRDGLLEDFTGHTCGNCPRAAEKAEELLTKYSDSIIVIANHVGGFAATKPKYMEDFTDAASNAWDAKLGMAGAGLPQGAVNRVQAPGYPQAYTSLATLIQSELKKPQTVKLDVTTTYDSTQKLLNVKVFTTFKAALPFNVGLIMVLTQDSIIASQTDYAPPPGAYVINGDRRPYYHFDHMMIKSLNGEWGQVIKNTPALNDTITVSKDCNTTSKCFLDQLCTRHKYMSVVVFAYNADTKEVLQAEKVRIVK